MKQEIEETQLSANQETKSSAGDKYETGRAMAQNAIDLLRSQLILADSDYQKLQTLKSKNQSNRIVTGSFIKTSLGYFYLSLSLGKVIIRDVPVMVLSAESPLGASLIGRATSDEIVFQNKTIQILECC
ncbi:MAG: hypothetical protein ACRCVT_00575 [Leadbetterella sp.]